MLGSPCISNFESSFYKTLYDAATSSVMSWTHPKSLTPLLNAQNLLSITRV